MNRSADSKQRAATVLVGVCAIGVVAAFVTFMPWPVGFGAAVLAAAAWCMWLEREQRAKVLPFPHMRSSKPRSRQTVVWVPDRVSDGGADVTGLQSRMLSANRSPAMPPRTRIPGVLDPERDADRRSERRDA